MRSPFLLSVLPLALAAPQLPGLPLPISPVPLPLPLGPSILSILDTTGVPKQDLIPNQYIVKVKTLAQVASILKLLNLAPLFTYNFNNFYGFAAIIPPILLAPLLKLPGIESIEQDAIVRASYLDHLDKRAYVTQSPSTWGLHRISHKTPASSASTYVYDNTAGNGTCAYVIDTGIFDKHTDFEGRALQIANFAADGVNSDTNGHGTHCAGTIGSKTYGVAKKAKIYGIKVLGKNGAGSNSAVIQGINFVAGDLKNARATACTAGAVISMSLGGSRSATVNAAAASAVANGLFIVAAAGNDAVDANNTSPASEPSVFTVAAADSTDRFATAFSNYGSFVDVLAPGVGVQSTWLANGVNTLSGTSMATPHVAGLALYLLGFEGKRSVADLTARIKALALKGVVKDVRTNTVNQVIYNGNPTG